VRATSILLLSAAFLSFSGEAGAQQADELTIKVSRPIVVYGESVTLSGAVPDRLTSVVVTVAANPLGVTMPQAIGAFGPKVTGWHTVVKPRIRTVFRAATPTETSRPVVVRVRPRVTLTRKRDLFEAKVVAGRPFVGRPVQLQMLSRSGRWKVLRRGVLRKNPTKFRTKLPATGRVRLRAFVPTTRKQPGYLDGFSKSLVVVSVSKRSLG
jgi:hypothetical protein